MAVNKACIGVSVYRRKIANTVANTATVAVIYLQLIIPERGKKVKAPGP
jgi:hypothetical protein